MAKVMISLPDDLLERIDAEASRRSSSRSALLREAAMREIGRPDPDEIDAALERLRTTFGKLGPFESADVVRAQRDSLNERDRRRL